MRVLINGVARELADSATVADAAASVGAPETGVAVAVRGEVLPRARWAETRLEPDDTVELLTAVQGG